MGYSLKTYCINYKALKLGTHQFEFELNRPFFEHFPEGGIGQGNLQAAVQLVKQNAMLELSILIKGNVEVSCDRCLEMFNLPLAISNRLIVKFGSETNTESDELWIMGENEHEISLAQHLYESVILSIPISKYHGMEGTKRSECNKDMLNRIAHQKSQSTSSPIDPRWSKLRDLTEN